MSAPLMSGFFGGMGFNQPKNVSEYIGSTVAGAFSGALESAFLPSILSLWQESIDINSYGNDPENSAPVLLPLITATAAVKPLLIAQIKNDSNDVSELADQTCVKASNTTLATGAIGAMSMLEPFLTGVLAYNLTPEVFNENDDMLDVGSKSGLAGWTMGMVALAGVGVIRVAPVVYEHVSKCFQSTHTDRLANSQQATEGVSVV